MIPGTPEFWPMVILMVLNTLVLPVVSYLRLRKEQLKVADQCAADLLVLQEDEIGKFSIVRDTIKKYQNFHRRGIQPFLAVSALITIIGLAVSWQNLTGVIVFFNVLAASGTIALALQLVYYPSVRHPWFMERVIMQVMENGRYAQVDSFLYVLDTVTWNKAGTTREEAYLVWGSLNAHQELKRAIRGNRFRITTKEDHVTKGIITKGEVKCREMIRAAEHLSVDSLVNLAENYQFWNHLVSNFERGNSLEMLEEMWGENKELRERLLTNLGEQRKYLHSFPHVFCPRCRSWANLMETPVARFVYCECEGTEAMVTGIERVLGMIGPVHLTGVSNSTYYLNVWEEEDRQVVTAEINLLVVSNEFKGNLDWALVAFLEAQHNRYPDREEPYPIRLPEGTELKDNTRKILNEMTRPSVMEI